MAAGAVEVGRPNAPGDHPGGDQTVHAERAWLGRVGLVRVRTDDFQVRPTA
jgi:hypothetical protein